MSVNQENVSEKKDTDSKYLTAADLISLRKISGNGEQLQFVTGQKYNSLSNNLLEEKELECILEKQKELLNQKIASRICDLIQAEWNEDLNVAITSKLKGKYVQHMGHVVGKKIHLSPEESLFLLQNKSIEILNQNLPLSLEEAYTVILKHNLSLEKYQVYSHLSQLGFIVVQHQQKLHATQSTKANLNKVKLNKKRRSSALLHEETKEKRLTFSNVLDNELEICNLSDTSVRQGNDTVLNDCQLLKVNEASVETIESNDSSCINTGDVTNNKENVNDFEDKSADSITYVPEDLVSSECTENQTVISATSTDIQAAENIHGDSELQNNSEIQNISTNFDDTFEDKDMCVTSTNTPQASPCIVSQDLSTSNEVLLNHKGHLPQAESDKGSSNRDMLKANDITNDLERVKEKYIPGEDNNVEKVEDYIVEENDLHTRDETMSDHNSVEMTEEKSDDDDECDVMSCSEDDESSDLVVYDTGSLGSLEEHAVDDEVTLVEVKKKEKTPLAVIDLLSDEEQDERMVIDGSNDSDEEIQIVKICPVSTSNTPKKSIKKCNFVKVEQKHRVQNAHQKFTSSLPKVKFPDLFRKDLICLARPQLNLLPNHVRPAKEAYVFDLKKKSENIQKTRVWSSYRDLQRPRHWNRNFDSNARRYPKQENRQFCDQNQYPENSRDVSPFQSNFHSTQTDFTPFSMNHSPREFSGARTNSNFNMGFMNLTPPNIMPGIPGNVMADLHRTAYSFATSMLTSMLGQSLNPQPQFNPYQPSRFRGMFSNFQSNQSNNMQAPPMLHEAPFVNNLNSPNQFNCGPSSSRNSDFSLGRSFDPLQQYSHGRNSPQAFNHMRNDVPWRFQSHKTKPFPCHYQNIRYKRSWNDVKAVVEKHDEVHDNNSDIEEVPINANEVLWSSDIKPLISPGTKQPIEDVLKNLQVTHLADFLKERNNIERYLPTTIQLKIAFDVYLPGTNYKRTCPEVPKYRIVVVRSSDPIPKYSEIALLQKKWNDGAVLQIAVVDNGDVTFYSFNSVLLPQQIAHV